MEKVKNLWFYGIPILNLKKYHILVLQFLLSIDFGGSVPIPEDIPLLKEIFGVENNLLNVLERTVLKFQTVKASIKGKNPGDFIEGLSDRDLIYYFKKLYIPSQRYVELIKRKN